jgi:hypothetical protein
MPGFFRALHPLRPTAKGLAYVKTESFLKLCQQVAHKILVEGKTWDDVDANLRDITIRELLPHRKYNADEVADFYRNHWRTIDGAWLLAVLKMKQDWLRIAADPAGFIRAFGVQQMK